jgi:hypothetical protein
VLEAGLGLRQRPLDEPDEEAAKALRLDEAAAAVLERLDPEAVLPVEGAGREKAGEPASSRTARAVG